MGPSLCQCGSPRHEQVRHKALCDIEVQMPWPFLTSGAGFGQHTASDGNASTGSLYLYPLSPIILTSICWGISIPQAESPKLRCHGMGHLNESGFMQLGGRTVLSIYRSVSRLVRLVGRWVAHGQGQQTQEGVLQKTRVAQRSLVRIRWRELSVTEQPSIGVS